MNIRKKMRTIYEDVTLKNIIDRFNFFSRSIDSGLSIFLNTLPKSGSVFIWDTLAEELGLKQVRISASHFPDDLVDQNKLQNFKHGGKIAQQHLPARRINLVLLEYFLDKMIVHIRDPRQSVLSWTHHLNASKEENRVLNYLDHDPPLPETYFDWEFHEQLNWQVENRLPQKVEWIENWIEVKENNDFDIKIKLTTYRDFNEEPEKFFNEIFRFYNLPVEKINYTYQQPDSGEKHYRKGKVDEWKKEFTKEQIKKARKMFSDKIEKQFN